MIGARKQREIGGRERLGGESLHVLGDREPLPGDDASENHYDRYPSEEGLFLLLSMGGMSSSWRRLGHNDNVAERTSKRANLGDFFCPRPREYEVIKSRLAP